MWLRSPIATVDWIKGEHVIQAEPMSFSFSGTRAGMEHTYPFPVDGMSICDRLVRRDSFCLNLAPEHWGWLLPHSTFLSRPGWGLVYDFPLTSGCWVGVRGDRWLGWAHERVFLCRAAQWASPCQTPPWFTLCTRTSSRVLQALSQYLLNEWTYGRCLDLCWPSA